MTKIILPELGEGITKATIACWHAKVGEDVVARTGNLRSGH